MENKINAGWQACPKCFGQGYVWFPPNLPLVETIASDGNPYCCDVCNGMKIINIKTGQPPIITASTTEPIKELAEIRGENRNCSNCKYTNDFTSKKCAICLQYTLWEPIK